MLDVDEFEVLKTTQATTSSDEIRQILDEIVEEKPSYDTFNNNNLKENNDPEVQLVKRSGLEAVNGGWSQNEGLVSLIFKVPGMNKDLRKNISINYQSTSVEVTMKNVRGCDYLFTIADLCEEIIPDQCFFSIKKKNEVIVRLKKFDQSFKWESLIRTKTVKNDIEYLIIRKELNKILNDTKISTVIKRQLSESISNAGHLNINSLEVAQAALNLLSKQGTSDVMTVKVKSVLLLMDSDAQVYQELVSKLAHTYCLVSLICKHEKSWQKHQQYLTTLIIGRCKVVEFTGYLTPQFSCPFSPDIKNISINLKKASHSSLFTNITIPETVKSISISIPPDSDPKSLSTLPILGKDLRLVFKGLIDSDIEWMLSCIGKTVGISKEEEYARLFWLVLENCHMSFVGLMAISSMLLPKTKSTAFVDLAPQLFENNPFSQFLPKVNVVSSSNEIGGVTDGSEPLAVTAMNCHSMLGVAVDLQNTAVSEETRKIIGNHFRQLNCPFLYTIDI